MLFSTKQAAAIRMLTTSVGRPTTSFRNKISGQNYFKPMSTSSSDTVLYDEINNKGILTLNRLKALNAIDLDMVRYVYSLFKANFIFCQIEY